MNESPILPVTYPLSAEGVADLVRTSVPPRAAMPPASVGPADGTVVAIGAFDGVHLGHRTLIDACVREARERSVRSVVVTFDPDPSELIVGAQAEPRLLSIEDRVALCHSLGIDEVLVLAFDLTLAALSPDEFILLLEERLGSILTVHVGDNFHFGVHGSGNVATLSSLGAARGFAVVSHPLDRLDGQPVSSTRIRGLLAQGKVEEAARLLGRCHFVRGSVDHGRGEGTSFGFPTANVRCPARTCMPSEGVYACVVSDGTRAWPAAANVGTPPTFESRRDACFLEANLLGFEGDLYGRELAVVFVAWLRASRPFSSLEELERTVLGNIDWVRKNVGASCVEVGP